MSKLFQKLREEVADSVNKGHSHAGAYRKLTSTVALGALLWGIGAVAEADNAFLPEEEAAISAILTDRLKISVDDLAVVLSAIRQAALVRMDLYCCCEDLAGELSPREKRSIVEDLFRVAYADRDLHRSELEVIQRIARLFALSSDEQRSMQERIMNEVGSTDGNTA